MPFYYDWLAQQRAGAVPAAPGAPAAPAHREQPEAPQPFNNELHTYTYQPRYDAGRPAEAAAQPAPQQPRVIACGPGIGGQWPNYANQYAYPQIAYMPYQYQYQNYTYAQQPAPAVQAYTGYYTYNPPQYYQTYPAYTVPAAAPAPATTHGHHHTWYGRTKAEVDEDNRRIAEKQAINKPNQMRPLNPKDDQLFWVWELDGTHQLRTYNAIENELQPGVWKTDPENGYAYFTRFRPD